jgi:translation initiation factor 6
MVMNGRGERAIQRFFNLDGSSFIGVFATCTETMVLVPPRASPRTVAELEHALQVKAFQITIAETSLLGCLVAGNSNGFLCSPYTLDSELQRLDALACAAGLPPVQLSRLPKGDQMTAAGNIILANDSVALIHPDLSEQTVAVVKDTLGVEVYKGTLGGLKTVGMAAVATNRGVLAHKYATHAELTFLEDIFGLPVEIGSVNFGIPLIGAALLANSKGFAVGAETTGPELGRIVDALGF